MMSKLAFVLFALIVAGTSNGHQEGQLKITVDYKPTNCEYKAKSGDQVMVHYSGKLGNGQVFDSSRAAGRQPIKFTLGTRQVIIGWEKGIEGMCIGEKRHLEIPPELAYGKAGRPPVIPENAWLYFDTELVDIEPVPTDATPDIQWVWGAIQFWSVPAVVIFVFYKLYQRYQEDTDTKSKAPKQGSGGKKYKKR